MINKKPSKVTRNIGTVLDDNDGDDDDDDEDEDQKDRLSTANISIGCALLGAIAKFCRVYMIKQGRYQ